METVDDIARALLNPAAASFADVVRVKARVEWATWARAVDEVERREAEIDAEDAPAVLKQAERSAIAGDVGREVAWSEMSVWRMASQARRLRDNTANVWSAFSEGRIDAAKAREISSAVDRLERQASIEKLDRRVVAYAETHTVVELRRWLKVFVARIEADLFNERAERARADRGVDVVHGDDGMSMLTIHHTSLVIGAIQKRLFKEAKALGADDERTVDQRQADLAASWLTTNEGGDAATNADVAVTITADALAGVTDQPAVAADGTWVAPVAWIRQLADDADNNVFWHRMVLDPVTDDVLSHEYRGRFAPAVLTKALEFRDGVCQAPGCCRPVWVCDIDHRIPFEAGGPTAAWNLGPYCRRHHILKGFGLLDVGPTSTSPPGRSRNTPLHSVGVVDFGWPTNPIEWLPASA